MNIQERDGVLNIRDLSKNIDCKYDGITLSGSGARKYKNDILAQIKDYKEVVGKIEEVSKSSDSELEDSYREIASLSSFIKSFDVNNIRSSKVTLADIQKWESDPIKYAYELYKYSLYLVGENGLISRTWDMFSNLHGLSSNLDYTDKNDENFEEDHKAISRYDSYINKETIIRDILKQSFHGTCMGYIIRNRFVQLLDIELYTPTRMIDGFWEVQIDLLKLTTANDNKTIYDYPNKYLPEKYNPKEEIISRQVDIVKLAFKRWQSGNGDRYFRLPVDKTIVIKYGSLQQERFGRPYVMGVMKEILHRELLKTAEEVLIDRLIHSIYVLTLGEKGKESEGNMKPTSEQRRAIGTSVRNILNKKSDSSEETSKIIAIPWWAEMSELVQGNLELFKTKKYEEVNQSILQGLSVGDILGASENGSYASASVSIDIFVKNVISVLAQIEEQLFNRQYRLMTKNMNNIFKRKFSRGTVILGSEKIEILKSLLAMGGSVKHVLDSIGIDYQEYINQVRAEKEEGLHDLFMPYRTSATMSDSSDGGRPTESDSGDNSNNNNPKPSTS